MKKDPLFTLLLIVVLSLTGISIYSCDPSLFEKNITAKITWSGSTTSAASSVSRSERSVTPPSFISSYYSKYGNLLHTITPTTFKLALQAVELANTAEYFNPVPFHQFDEINQTWIMQYGDFTTPLAATPEGTVKPGFYSDFMIFFFSRPGIMGMSSTPGIFAESSPVVIVDLPSGYEDFITEDVPYKYDGTNSVTPSGNTYYLKKKIDSANGIFQFSLDQLFPTDNDDPGNAITMEIFNFTGSEYKVFAPGVDGVPEYYDILEYKDTPGMGIGGNNIFTKIPWEGITIKENAASVVFTLTWNLDGILELYDNNTADILSDDILVLTDRFWERLSFSANQYGADGNLLE